MVRAWRIFGVALVIAVYFFQAPLAYGIFALWALIPNRNPDRRARMLQFAMMSGFWFMHLMLRWMRILDFDPREVEGEIPDTPCVMVANHPTLTDVSAMLATERNLVFPVKPALFGSFWARPLLGQAGHFAGAGPGALAVGSVIDDAVDRLERGYRVIIFPEGTRSPEKGLHPFGRSAFEIACRAGVPIVPLFISCKPRWLWKQRGFFDPPDKLPQLRIRALPAVRKADHPMQ